MSRQIQDLANGLGYIYITDPKSNILEVLENNEDHARKIKLKGVESSALGGNRVATSIITIDTPTGAGDITAISIAGNHLISTPISYTEATSASILAQNIVDSINSHSEILRSKDFSAVRVDNVIYIFSDESAGSSFNGVTPVLVNTGNFTYTVNQDMIGGSSNLYSYDEYYGYRFYLDADYGVTQCSGGGIAPIDSISNAVEITSYIVNRGLQGSIPINYVDIMSDSVHTTREASISHLVLKGEGGLNDDLENLIIEGAVAGDIVMLSRSTMEVTVTNSGNISIHTTTISPSYVLSSGSILTLSYTGTGWVEISRNKGIINSVSEYRGVGYGIFALEDYKTSAIGTTGTITYVAGIDEKYQKLTGSSTLSGSLSYVLSATAEDGDEFWLEYDASVIVGAFPLTIYGISLTAEQALTGGLIFYARFLNGAWYSHVYPNFNQGATYPFKSSTGFYKDASVTVAKVETTLRTDLITAQISWDANRKGDHKIVIPYPCTVDGIYVYADDLIEATDAASANFKDNSGLSMGTVTFTGGDTIGTGYSLTPTSNNSFTAGQILTITTTKTTAGGNAKVSIKVTKS